MDVEALVRVLKQEETDASSFYTSELAKAQEEALDRYFGRPYGDEIEGRSKVVSHDVEDAVNWIMPDLMRTFTSSEDLVSLKAQNPEDDGQFPGAPEGKSKADIMAAFAAHVFFEDNRGAENVHDFLFDGLLLRLGVLKVSWSDPEPSPPILIEGVGEQQLSKYLSDPEYEILGFDDEPGPDGPVFVLEVRRTPKMGRVHVEAVAPEEFAIDKLSSTVKDARYHRRKRRAYVAELARKYPDSAEALKARKPNDSDPGAFDARVQARTPDVSAFDRDSSNAEGRAEVWLCEEYIRIDFDGDGIVELRHVKRVDDIVLENIAVTRSEYVCWTPSRVSHKVVGRSVYDMLKDITRLRTVITRRYVDALAQAITPRTYVLDGAVDQDGIDSIEANDIGGVIKLLKPVGDAVREVVTPDVSGPALTALEYFDQRGAEASGVTKQAQGMDPAAMNKTATGIDLLQAAAKTRIEMFARWAGVALEDVFKLILQLLAEHQDGPRMVKLFGKWVEIDPRTWSDEMAVKVDIGSAGVSKQQRLTNLAMIAQKQENVLMTAGPTPLVTLQHLRNSYTSMVSEMGFPDPSYYFGEIPDNWQPEPKPDPKTMEVQAKMQLEQGKAQIQAQTDQQRMAQDREKAAADLQLARDKAAAELELAREKAQAEFQLAREKALLERELAKEKLQYEFDLAERDSVRQAQIGMVAAKSKGMNGSGSHMSSNRPGGDLSQ